MTRQFEDQQSPELCQDAPFGGHSSKPNSHYSTVPGAAPRKPPPNPAGRPWNGVAILNVLNGALQIRAGTGFLIADDVLVTAGHLLDGDWTTVNAWMGYDAELRPDGPRALLRATPRRHSQLDLAVLIVEPRSEAVFEPLAQDPSPVTLAGYGFSAEDRPLYRQATGAVLTSGDPATTYKINTQEADSGAPLFVDAAGKVRATAIHLRGAGPGQLGNHGMRFTPAVVAELDQLITTARNSIR